MKTLIRGATVVLPAGQAGVDVLLDGTVIADIDPAIQVAVDQTVHATGLHLLPGVVDDQVHFREPGLTHKEDLASATRACAKGGVTTFLEMPNTIPTTTSAERLEEKLALASRRSLVNYGFYVGATPHNLLDLQQIERQLADSTPGIKIFIGSSTGDLLVDDQDALEGIFAHTRLPITAHCEDESTVRANAAKIGPTTDVRDHSRIRDVRAAVIATQRALDLAVRHHHRFHLLHTSTAAETEFLTDPRGLITAEVCLHHLLFNVTDYERLGTLVQMNPSLKSAADNEGLWAALLDGRIQIIATDHAPHTLAEKNQPYPASPSGLPAVENSLALMLDQVCRGRCGLEQVVHWMCDAPARTWDLVGKGRITPGYDADLVLVDLDREHTIRNAEQLTKCGWTPWDGRTLTGLPVKTWVRGQLVYDEGRVCDEGPFPGRAARFDHGRGGYWATA